MSCPDRRFVGVVFVPLPPAILTLLRGCRVVRRRKRGGAKPG